uniref:Ribonuclease H-like domain-containing protein n=1 Tax=Tanacetum cinerariifolium TaxID=118510 RepID=A0A6L2JWJ2_TANCI|nr:ribonuclease H-like domain-containing protein [Tanacetum cinerariifolium]
MVSSIKLPILKKGEYILWTMKIEQYLAHIDYALWEVILNGNSVVQMTKDEAGNEIEVPLVTAQQIFSRTRERKAKSTLLMAIPNEHIARIHIIKDAKTLWAAIKTRFGEGLDKGYDRFQRLLSQVKIHGAGVSTEDANQKFLRSLPSAWSNISLIMGNNLGIDNLDIDDLTSSTNELNATYSVSTATGHSSQAQVAMLSMRVKRFYKKTERKLEFNGKEPVSFDKNKVECFNCHRRGHFAKDCRSARNSGNKNRDARNAGYRGKDNDKRPAKEEDEQALVVQDGLGTYDSSYQLEEKTNDFALMAFTSNHSSSSSSNYKEEVTKIVFNNRSSDEENSVANDRFKKGEGYHAVPPPLTGNYISPKPDMSFAGLDDSIYKFKISETVTSLAKDEKDAPETSTACVQKPKEDRIAKKSVLPTNVGKGTGHRESRPIWNNVQRINHKKILAPTAVFTRSGRIPVSAAKPKAAALTSAAKPVNTVGPKQSVNFSRIRSTFHKSHSPIRRSFYNATTHSRRNSTERVSTAGSKAVSGVKGNGVTTVKTLARNKAYLADYQEIHNGGFVAFGSSRVSAENQTDKNAGPQNTNGNEGTQDNVDAGKEMSDQDYIVLPLWSSISSTYKSSYDKPANDKPKDDTGSKTIEEPVNKEDQAYKDELERILSQEKETSYATNALRKEFKQGCMDQRGITQAGSTNSFNTVSNPVNAASTSGTFSAGGPSSPHPDAFILANTLLHVDQDDSQIPNLEETAELQSTGIFNSAYDDDLDIYTSLVQSVGVEADFNNMESSTIVSPITTHKMEPKKVSQSLDDEIWVEAMQEELMQFSLQKVWRLVDLPYGKKDIGTKWMFHVTPNLLHLQAVKRIFRYLKGQPKLGLWYPRDSLFELEAYSDKDYAGANLDRKSTTEGCQFLGWRLISWQCKKQTIVATSTIKAEYVVVAHENVEFHQIVDFLSTCSINYALTEIGSGNRSRRQETTLGGADAQTRFKTASKRSSDPPLSTGHTVRRREDMMEQETDLTDFVPPTPYDSPLLGGHTPRSDEGRPNLLELMNICTKLSNRVFALEEAMTTQDKMITKLKLRVGRLEKKRKARTSQPMKRRLFKGRVETSTDKSLDKGSGEKGGSTADQVSTARPEVSAATPSTPPTTTTTIFGDEDLTIAQTLIKTRSDKAKEKGVAFRYVEEPPRLTRSTTTLQPLLTIDPKDKGKGVLVEEPEKLQKVKKRDQGLAQIKSDADLAQRIYEEELAELDRAQKEIQKQEEATIAALTEEFDEIQARIDADHELAELQMLYEREKKWIDNFVPMDSEMEEKKSVESESKDKKGKRIKRVADSAPKQKSSKKPKMMQEQESAKSDEEESADHEQENEELRMWLTVLSDEEETVHPNILSTKYLIVDWESQILGNVDMEDRHVYKIIRANKNTSYRKSLSSVLRKFDRQDLVDLYRLVMKRFEDNTPEGYNLLL